MSTIISMKRTNEQKIHNLIEHNDRLVHLAIVAAESGEQQSVNDIVNALYETFLVVASYKEKCPEKYQALVKTNIPPQTKIASLYRSQSDYYNEYTYLSSFRSGLVRIWISCYTGKLWSSANNVIFKVQKFLEKFTQALGNEVEVENFLFLLSQASNHALDKDKDRYLIFLRNCTYEWYFNIAFRSSDDVRFQIEYLNKFDEFLWAAFKRVIAYDALDLYKSMISTILQRANAGLVSRRPFFDYFDSLALTDESIREISSLDRRISKTSDLNSLTSHKAEIEQFLLQHQEDLLPEVNAEKLLPDLFSQTESYFKSNNLKIYLFLLGAFLEFKKKYSWIEFLWEYQQPNDADASWGASDVLPGDVYNVFRYLINQLNFQMRVEFSWEDRHGVTQYYKNYGILLLARLLLLHPRYVFHEQLLDPALLFSSVSYKELDLVSNIAQDLLSRTKVLDRLDYLKDRKTYKGVAIKEAVESLLERIKIGAVSEKKKRGNSQTFTAEEREEFVNHINYHYLDENQFAKIFGALKIIEEPSIEGTNRAQKIPYTYTRLKGDFIDELNNLGPSIGFQVARELGFSFTDQIRFQISSKAVEVIAIPLEELSTKFDSILFRVENWEKPVAIGLGIDFEFYLWNNAKFEALGGESEYVGRLLLENRKIEFFNISNWNYSNSFFIVDATHFGSLKLIKPIPEAPLESKDFLHYHIPELNTEIVQFSFAVYFRLNLLPGARIIQVDVIDEL
jgi:hypothetical protein